MKINFTFSTILLIALNCFAQPEEFQQPVTVEFSRGNAITFPGGTSLYRAQDPPYQVTTVITTQPIEGVVEWILPSGESIQLECGPYPLSIRHPHGKARVITFYKSGEYNRGCSTVGTPSFEKESAFVQTMPNASLTLDQQGGFNYAGSIKQGWILIEDQKIALAEGSEISFHPEGNIDFFTPQKEASFVSQTAYGPITFTQFVENPVYFRFFKDGHIQNGVLGQDLQVGSIHLEKGSGIFFEKNPTSPFPFIETAKSQTIIDLQTNDGYQLNAQLVNFRQSGQVNSIVTTAPFVFTDPLSGKPLFVPEPSIIYFNEDMNIREIKIGHIPTN